jgi:hypothetical protein
MGEHMELKDLVGEHILSGVDFESSNQQVYNDLYRDCEIVNFVLDGEVYTAIQDPDDGYRSCMGEIKKSDVKVSNMFKPCKVIGQMRVSDLYKCEIIDFVDVYTNKIILSIGTEALDDYYPCWVAEFSPENMVINQQSRIEEQARIKILVEIYNDLKDEVHDNPNCQFIASKKLAEIINRLYGLIEICRRSSVQ